MDMRRRQAIGVGVATSLAFASGLSAAAASETATGPKSEPQEVWLDQGGDDTGWSSTPSVRMVLGLE
jgi:hypothetical protein